MTLVVPQEKAPCSIDGREGQQSAEASQGAGAVILRPTSNLGPVAAAQATEFSTLLDPSLMGDNIRPLRVLVSLETPKVCSHIEIIMLILCRTYCVLYALDLTWRRQRLAA